MWEKGVGMEMWGGREHLSATPLLGWFATLFNTLRPRQNGRHFADVTFNRIFVNENVRISIEFH